VAWGQFSHESIGLLQGENMSTIDSSTLDSLADRIREVAARRGSESTEDLVEREIARQSEVSLLREHSSETESELRRHLHSRLYGLGPLQEFLDDPEVEEIWINEPDRVFIARGGVSERVPLVLDGAQVRDLAEKMLRTTGRRVDLSQPFADASLPDGSRVHVVIPDITRRHWSINIRKFSRDIRDVADLVSRAVVDRAGKAEVLMLIPLVMMILPITVIFAVWPSLQALESNVF
jgi:pilus assembly protein CpaF